MEFDVSFDGHFPKWTYTSLYITDFQFTVIYSFFATTVRFPIVFTT